MELYAWNISQLYLVNKGKLKCSNEAIIIWVDWQLLQALNFIGGDRVTALLF